MVVCPDSYVSQIVEGFDVEDGLPPAMDTIYTNGIPELLVEIAIVDLFCCVRFVNGGMGHSDSIDREMP